MPDVLEKYGFTLGRNSFMCCPFHAEKTPSFKVYSEGRKFKCFGCGEGGSVIDFVMKYFELEFKQALEKINADFGLGLSMRTPSRYQQMEMAKLLRQRQKVRESAERDEKIIDDVYFKSLADLNYYEKMQKRYKPDEVLFVIASEKITELNFLIDLIEMKRGEIFVRENATVYD